VVAAQQDSYLDGPSARALVKAAGSQRKQVAVFPGTYHGWDLLYSAPYRSRVWALVLRWVAGLSRPPARAVSWVDQPLAAYRTPQAHLIRYPTDAPPCNAADLRLRKGRGGAATGHVLQELVLTNIGSSACLVRGYATLTALDPHGSRVMLPARKSPTFFGQLLTADAAPGAHVFVLLETGDICSTPGTRYREVALTIPSGTVQSNVSIGEQCGLWMTRVGRPQRFAAPRARPGTPGTLAARLLLPRTARQGGLMRFTVALSNPTAQPVKLEPCPGYTESLFAQMAFIRATYRLNCSHVTTIAPYAEQRYAMQLRVPRRAAAYAKVGWSLDTANGPFAGGVVRIP
jgi:hypothetical protein